KDKSPVKARISLKRNGNDETFSLFNELGRGQQNVALTDQSGNWKFKDLPKGTYKIIIEPVENESDYQRYTGDYGNSNRMTNVDRSIPPKPKLAKKTEEITINDKDITEMVIEVGYGATISGTATVENSQEMPKSMTIQASGEKDESAVSTIIGNYRNTDTETPSKTNHDFKLENVPEGKNYFNVFTGDTDYYIKSATLNGTDLLGNLFEVKEGEVLRNVQIILSKDVGTLKGTVLNDEKEPVKGLELSIIPTDAAKRKNASYLRSATSNENGEFEVKDAPGEYAIIFYPESLTGKNREEILKWLDDAIKEAQTVKIEAGKTETVTVKKKK
ncbi:MAG: carboxypeptidase-like regulatory domain-containing protein, partial [Actinomycetota bacterium]